MNKEFWTELVEYFEDIWNKPYSMQDKYDKINEYVKAWEQSKIKGELTEELKKVMANLGDIAMSGSNDAYLKYKKILTECEKRNIYL